MVTALRKTRRHGALLRAGVAAVAAALLLPGAGAAAQSTPTASPQGPFVSASGTATIPAPTSSASAASEWVVNAQIQVRGTVMSTLVVQAQGKLRTVNAALAKIGVPSSQVGVQNINVSPVYGKPGPPSCVSGYGKVGGKAAYAACTGGNQAQTTPKVTGFTLNDSLQVDVHSLSQLAGVVAAASAAGATNINTFSQGLQMTVQPQVAAL